MHNIKRILELIDFTNNDTNWVNIKNLPIDSLSDDGNPIELTVLDYRDTTLTSLPQGLMGLYCKDSPIKQLPELPDSLIELQCTYKQLSSLTCLPKTLEYLWCLDSPNYIAQKYDEYPTQWMSKFIARTNEEIESKQRSLMRCSAIKEELMTKLWFDKHQDQSITMNS